jgi:methionyl-tRNA synthetase
MPEIREVDEEDAPSYPVITGDYRTAARWASQPVVAGTRLAAPTPLFTKLDQSVVDEELARLEQEQA